MTGSTSIAVAMLLIGGVCGFVSPVAAVSAMVIASPLIFHPVAIADGEFSLLELAIVLGVMGIALRVAVDAVRRRDITMITSVVRPWSLTIGLVLLVGAAVISLSTLAEVAHRPESLREFRLVIVEPLMFIVLCRWILSCPRQRSFVIGVLAAVGAAVGVMAVGEAVLGGAGVMADGVRRATGPYPHPNNLALFLERIGIFSVCLAVFGDWRPRWFAIAAFFALIGVGATFSRGAALAILIGLLIVFVARRHRRAVWATVSVAVVLAAVTVLEAGDRVLDTGSTGAESTRILIWRSSLRMALDHPVWGVGLDQFLTQYWPRYVDPAGWPERYTSHAHNLILDVWLRLGIPGLAAAAWLSVVVVKRGTAALRSTERSDAISIGAAAALVTGFVHGMVDNGFFLPDLALLTWLMVILLETKPSDVATVRSPAPTIGSTMGTGE